MKALKIRYIAFIVIGLIAFSMFFLFLPHGFNTGHTDVKLLGSMYIIAALILWAIGITGLMQVKEKEQEE